MALSFDAIVIGAGQAGPSLAGRLAAGMRVAVIERKHVGGTCVNTGCMPTKALVASAYAAHFARCAADYGVKLDATVTVDPVALRARQRNIAETARAGVERWLEQMKGCTLVRGHAQLISARAVRVGDRTPTADRIFINVGGRAAIPDLPGIKDVPYLTSSSLLEMDTLPRHLVVIGGSYIGLEFGQMYRRFGSEVAIVEKGARLIGREDPDLSDAIRAILEREAIKVRLDATCIGLAHHGRDVAVTLNCRSGEPKVVGSHVLLALSRRPNTDDLGLDGAGVATDEGGFIIVDDELRTSAPGIWALGDCNGRGAFTHTSYNDFEIVAANLLDGDARRVSALVPAYALYIDPPLGRVDLTETEARCTGRKLLVGTRPMTRVGRAIERGETQGFMKVVADAETEQILGASILGASGDEAIHGILDAINAKTSCSTLQRAVPIHPTVSELIPTLLSEMRPLVPS